jgi:hypothetical protein
LWLNTFVLPKIVACTYAEVRWRFSWPRSKLSFLDVESWVEAEFIAP